MTYVIGVLQNFVASSISVVSSYDSKTLAKFKLNDANFLLNWSLGISLCLVLHETRISTFSLSDKFSAM